MTELGCGYLFPVFGKKINLYSTWPPEMMKPSKVVVEPLNLHFFPPLRDLRIVERGLEGTCRKC